MNKAYKELDQKIFNAVFDLAHVMIDKGYAKAWFIGLNGSGSLR